MSKLLFIVLVGCTAVLASPVDLKTDAKQENESFEIIPPTLAFMRNTFGKSYSKISDTIVGALKEIFNDIEDRLDSKKFRDSINELKSITDRIFNEENELKGDEETKKIIEDQLQKVNGAFESMLDKGIKYMKKRNNRTVDATHFQFAVDTLKKSVDSLYSQ